MSQLFVGGKVIILGEHSVVHGGLALALPAPTMGLRFDSIEAPKLIIEPLGFESTIASLSETKFAFITEHLSLIDLGHGVRVTGGLPAGVGMGFSAALSYGLARMCIPEPQQAYLVADKLEQTFHGKASGLDLAAVAAAGPIVFQKGSEPRLLASSAETRMWFAAAAFPVDRTTKELVASVQYQCEQSVEKRHALSTLKVAAEQGIEAIEQGDSERFASAMNTAHTALNAFGLYGRHNLDLQQAWCNDGALAAKLSGAGGGGLSIALASSEEHAQELARIAATRSTLAAFSFSI